MFILAFAKFVFILGVTFAGALWLDKKIGISEYLFCHEGDHKGHKTLMHWITAIATAFVCTTLFTFSWQFIIITIIAIAVTFGILRLVKKS